MTYRSGGRGSPVRRLRTLVGVMRLLLSPRWMVWHVLTLGAMVACGWLAVWQWQRAGSAMGSALNIGYGLQWPVFAVFFGVMWFRFLRMEIRDLRAAGVGVEPGDPAAPSTDDGDRPAGAVPAPRDVAPEPTADAADATADEPARPSPFTARPAGVTAPRSTDPQLRAYNEELARLSVRHREESTP
ncbi:MULTISPECIES: hypothetical protein [unclassified Pseudonocardia]|uniref:hypothetical protein n=2 Tax=Pseudonocardia TaxID=1847 RepID=UPI0009E85A8F|nr:MULTISPECIES: hypothetical protein [unclassified Pseudonocardia]